MNGVTLLSVQNDYQYIINIGFFFMLIAIAITVISLFNRAEKRTEIEEIQAKIKANEKKIATNDAELERLIAEDNSMEQ